MLHAPVIYFPGLNSFSEEAAGQKIEPRNFDFLINSGRAVILPVFDGAFERYDGFDQMPAEEKERGYRDHILNWHSDLGRTLDYLESREDIDNNSFAFLGASYGASTATPLIVLEPRIKVAILAIGGFSFRIYPLISDPLTYVSRITQPVLMLSGRFDNVFPLETRATPFFNMLGTPEQDKKHVIFNGGHRPPPRNIFVTEVVDWLDKYQN